jgi:glutathione S-transferase
MVQWLAYITRSSSNRKSFSITLLLCCYQPLTTNRRRGVEGDADLVSTLSSKLETVLAVYETILSTQKYLARGELTLADLYHLPYGILIKTLGFAEMFASYPHLNEWFDGLSARKSWMKTISE